MGTNNGNGWKKGETGNPNGRPQKGLALAEEIRKLGGSAGKDYVELLDEIARDTTANIKARIEATKVLLDRGFGKPPQEVHVTGEQSLTDEQMDAMSVEQMKEVRALWLRAHEVATGVTEH